MNANIEQMLCTYNIDSIYDKKNAMKEIIQEIVLCGLSRAGFFEKACFYGGTALRIFYGLDRFSEDLDFSLMEEDDSFDFASYFSVVEKEVRAFGLNLTIDEKKKTRNSSVKSAFLKGNTREHLLLFHKEDVSSMAKNEMIKIKLEVDVDPPGHATYEHKYRLLPSPYEVNMYDMPSLFAGKIHAVLCRAWKSRVKGRDLYDYVFYLSRKVAVNQKHLKARLVQSGHIKNRDKCGITEIKQMLCDRFDAIDFGKARQDVEPFVTDTSSLGVWCADFFRQITQQLTVC